MGIKVIIHMEIINMVLVTIMGKVIVMEVIIMEIVATVIIVLIIMEEKIPFPNIIRLWVKEWIVILIVLIK